VSHTAPYPTLVAVALLCGIAFSAGCPSSDPVKGDFAGEDANDGTRDTNRLADASEQDAGANDTASTDSAAANDSSTTADVSSGDASATDAGVPFIKPCGGAKDGIWTVTFGSADKDTAEAIIPTSDGGFAIAATVDIYGGADTMTLLRINKYGNKIWQRSYGGGASTEGRDALGMDDGGFVIGGCIAEKDSGYRDMYIVRADKDGKVGAKGTWTVTEGNAKNSDCVYALTAGHKSAIVAAGFTKGTNTSGIDGRLQALTPDGKPLWERTVSGGSNSEYLRDVVADKTGYVAAGESYASGKGMWAVALDHKGKPRWNKHYGKTGSDRANAIALRDDGGTLIAGKATIYACLWAVALDETGAEQWHHELCDKQSEEAFAIAMLHDGGFALIGKSSTNGSDALLLRLNRYGSRLFTRKFVDEHKGTTARGYDIVQLPDHGFLIAGEVYGQPDKKGGADMLIMRTDRWGHASCKYGAKCANMLPTACDDGSACTVGLCDNVDGCIHKGLPDNAMCGAGKTCLKGACK